MLIPAPVKTMQPFDAAMIPAIRIALDAIEAGDSLTSGKCVAVLALQYRRVKEWSSELLTWDRVQGSRVRVSDAVDPIIEREGPLT